MNSSRIIEIVLLWALAGAAIAAGDPKAFTVSFPQEVLSAVITGAVTDAQKAKAGAATRFPIEELKLELEPGKTATVTIRTNLDAIRAVAKDHAKGLLGKFEQWLLQGSASDYLAIRLKAKLTPLAGSAAPDGSPNDVALALDFDSADLDLELHRGSTVIKGNGFDELGLRLIDAHLASVHISDSVDLSSQMHWWWKPYFLRAKGHRAVVKFSFKKFPFVPFTIDADGITTNDHVLSIAGHRR